MTGCCGFIGTNFVEMLHKVYPDAEIGNIDSITEVANDHLIEKFGDEDWYYEYPYKVEDYRIVENLVSANIPDIIVHLAAESHVDKSCENVDPFVTTNIGGCVSVAKAAIKHNIPYIQISTDEVYGHLTDHEQLGFTEHRHLDPRNPYAASKASADMMVQALGIQNPNWKYAITRCTNNYGPHQDDSKFLAVIIKKLMAGEKIPVYGDGLFYRQWIHVDDHCSAIIKLMDFITTGTLRHNVYNVGPAAANCISNVEFIKRVATILRIKTKKEYFDFEFEGENPIIDFIEDPRGNCHDRVYLIESQRMHALGWNADVSDVFTNSLTETVNWYKNERNRT